VPDTKDPWSDLVIDPTTTTANGGKATLFAAVGNASGSASNGVYVSTDSGKTWNPVSGVQGAFQGSTGRIALALSHPASNASATLYVSIATSLNAAAPATPGALLAFDVSTNVSTALSMNITPNWAQQATPDIFQATEQGWYDNVVAADPNTPATVY